jgi:hypothetical protein
VLSFEAANMTTASVFVRTMVGILIDEGRLSPWSILYISSVTSFSIFVGWGIYFYWKNKNEAVESISKNEEKQALTEGLQAELDEK